MYDQTISWIILLGTFRLLANCVLLFCSDFDVNIPDLLFNDPIESRHRVLGKGTYSYSTPPPSIFYSNVITEKRKLASQKTTKPCDQNLHPSIGM